MINVVWAVDIAATWLTPAKKLLPKKIFPLKEEISCTYPKIINFSNDKAKILPKKNSRLPEKNDFPSKEKISYNYLKKKKKFRQKNLSGLLDNVDFLHKEKIYYNYSPLKKLISLTKKFLTLIQKIFSIFWMKNYHICLKINQSFLYLPRKQVFKLKIYYACPKETLYTRSKKQISLQSASL